MKNLDVLYPLIWTLPLAIISFKNFKENLLLHEIRIYQEVEIDMLKDLLSGIEDKDKRDRAIKCVKDYERDSKNRLKIK